MGIVCGVDEDHDIVVQYPSRNRLEEPHPNLYDCIYSKLLTYLNSTSPTPSPPSWTFNPVCLKKVSDSEGLPPLTLPPGDGITEDRLCVGDFVKISSDIQLVKSLQAGHGEWVDTMAQVNVP